jgi:hypothetical protein
VAKSKIPGNSLPLEEKKLLFEGISFLDEDSDFGNLPLVIFQAQEILAKWWEEVRN